MFRHDAHLWPNDIMACVHKIDL